MKGHTESKRDRQGNYKTHQALDTATPKHRAYLHAQASRYAQSFTDDPCLCTS